MFSSLPNLLHATLFYLYALHAIHTIIYQSPNVATLVANNLVATKTVAWHIFSTKCGKMWQATKQCVLASVNARRHQCECVMPCVRSEKQVVNLCTGLRGLLGLWAIWAQPPSWVVCACWVSFGLTSFLAVSIGQSHLIEQLCRPSWLESVQVDGSMMDNEVGLVFGLGPDCEWNS